MKPDTSVQMDASRHKAGRSHLAVTWLFGSVPYRGSGNCCERAREVRAHQHRRFRSHSDYYSRASAAPQCPAPSGMQGDRRRARRPRDPLRRRRRDHHRTWREGVLGRIRFALGERAPEVLKQPLVASEITRRRHIGKPLIAAVNGLALGLGFELALAPWTARRGRSRAIWSTGAPRGAGGDGWWCRALDSTVGTKRALGMILTGNMVSADDGLRLGSSTRLPRPTSCPAPGAGRGRLPSAHRCRSRLEGDGLSPRRIAR